MKLKLIILSIVSLCMFAFAQDPANLDVKCNTPTDVKYPGLPPTSCWIRATTVSINMDFSTVTDPTTGAVVSNAAYTIDLFGLTVPGAPAGTEAIRFQVAQNSPFYHEFQALTQTAYATKSVVMAIMPNPTLSGHGCYQMVDRFVCPLQSIGLAH